MMNLEEIFSSFWCHTRVFQSCADLISSSSSSPSSPPLLINSSVPFMGFVALSPILSVCLKEEAW